MKQRGHLGQAAMGTAELFPQLDQSRYLTRMTRNVGDKFQPVDIPLGIGGYMNRVG